MADVRRSASEPEHAATIKVVGVGGGGCNAVNRMIAAGLAGVDFFAVNSDVQALRGALTENRVHIGGSQTRGLGAGANPTLGREAAEASREDLALILDGADLVFLTAGMGGGTGTGAAPVIAELARESGALTIAVVTKPFAFEGKKRMQIAENGIAELEAKVDTLITIPNERILQVIEKKTPLNEAFSYADDVLRQGIAGISDLITQPGSDQPRLRRRQDDHDRRGFGDDGHRRRHRRASRRRRRAKGDRVAVARDDDRRRARRDLQHHRRPRHGDVRSQRSGRDDQPRRRLGSADHLRCVDRSDDVGQSARDRARRRLRRAAQHTAARRAATRSIPDAWKRSPR